LPTAPFQRKVTAMMLEEAKVHAAQKAARGGIGQTLAPIAPFQTGSELLSAKREEQNLGRIAEADARLADVAIPSSV
jgi:hypothetical protein